jgi:hypothetical protein
VGSPSRRTLGRTPMHEQDSALTNERAENDCVHLRVQPRTSDRRSPTMAAVRRSQHDVADLRSGSQGCGDVDRLDERERVSARR